MGWREEFPDMGDIAGQANTLIAAGFADESWKNDECPRFTRTGPEWSECVWIDDAKAVERGTWLYSYTRWYVGTEITAAEVGTHDWRVIKLLAGI